MAKGFSMDENIIIFKTEKTECIVNREGSCIKSIFFQQWYNMFIEVYKGHKNLSALNFIILFTFNTSFGFKVTGKPL